MPRPWLVVPLCAALLAAPPAARAAGAVLVMNSERRLPQRHRPRQPPRTAPHPGAARAAPLGADARTARPAGGRHRRQRDCSYLDPATFALRRRMPVADPYQLGFSPDGKFLVVNGLARDQVDVYDAADLPAGQALPAGVDAEPPGLCARQRAPCSSRCRAPAGSPPSTCAAWRVRWTAEVGTTPAGVLWLNGRVLVAEHGQRRRRRGGPGDGHVERRIHTGKGAHQLFL